MCLGSAASRVRVRVHSPNGTVSQYRGNITPEKQFSKHIYADANPEYTALVKKIADAFGVSLDYLVGEGINASFDKKTVSRIQALEGLEETKKNILFDLIDTYIRDLKTRQAYTQ